MLCDHPNNTTTSQMTRKQKCYHPLPRKSYLLGDTAHECSLGGQSLSARRSTNPWRP